MPVATAIGVAPEVLAASVCHAPYGQDELGIAGGFRGDPLPVVKCKTLDLEVPATAEIVLEGFVASDPSQWQEEGPFGEFPGYYGGVKMRRPTIRLSAVTHRENPIFQGTLEGAPPNESSTIRTIGHTLGAWRKLREEGKKEGVIEAVYKISVNDGHAIWLKDQAMIEAYVNDRVYLSPGVLTIVSKEMEAEDELKKHRDRLETIVQERTVDLTKLNEQLRLEILEREAAEKKLQQSYRKL